MLSRWGSFLHGTMFHDQTMVPDQFSELKFQASRIGLRYLSIFESLKQDLSKFVKLNSLIDNLADEPSQMKGRDVIN